MRGKLATVWRRTAAALSAIAAVVVGGVGGVGVAATRTFASSTRSGSSTSLMPRFLPCGARAAAFSLPAKSWGERVCICLSGLWARVRSAASARFEGVFSAFGVRSPRTRRLVPLEGVLACETDMVCV